MKRVSRTRHDSRLIGRDRHVNREGVTTHIGVYVPAQRYVVTRRSALIPSCGTEPALANRLIQRPALDAVVEPRMNRVIQLALRLGSGGTLRRDVEVRADGDPTSTGIASYERTQLNLQLDRFAHDLES